MRVGLLPASGSATRLRGIPKFCLPISNSQSLLEWHVIKMLSVCDEVRISTRKSWIPIVEQFNLPVKIYEIEPSTMSDALKKMTDGTESSCLIGMPDTYIAYSSENFYEKMSELDCDIAMASWECHPDLFGRVGQIDYIDTKVTEVVDKNFECKLDRMWGGLAFNISMNMLDDKLSHPGLQINEFINKDFNVQHVPCSGKYIDAGTIGGIKELYESLTLE